MRERWYLYGNDAELALELLRRDLHTASSLEEQAWLVRFLPNLGRHEEAAHWLRQRQLQTQAPNDPIGILQQVHYSQWADLPARLLDELEHWLSPES